ncbi:MAG: ABC transporter ATP-binding protein [Burkholderiales bacterium]|nr:ABC transporter ATP-binding protein [Burkholderiales bacterium]
MLSVDRLTRVFGGVRAVDDVSFSVAAGELVALIGPNGAGKTTCFNLVNGQLVPDTGRVLLDGARIDGLSAHSIARRGVGRTFQVAATFASMTVRENLRVAMLARAGHEGRISTLASAVDDDAVDTLLARVGCLDLADAHCAALAYGNAKRVELALALADRPRLLLMDEPTAGMATRSSARLMQVASDLAKLDAIAVLFTEHDMDVVFGFADRVIVLDHGRIIAQGTPDAVRADPKVREVYLGEGANTSTRKQSGRQ